MIVFKFVDIIGIDTANIPVTEFDGILDPHNTYVNLSISTILI